MMRKVAMLFCSGLLCSAVLTLSACVVGREDVKSTYVGTASMTEAQVTQLLNEKGYHEIINLHLNGPDWVGSATKDGSPVSFDIDKGGNIHTK